MFSLLLLPLHILALEKVLLCDICGGHCLAVRRFRGYPDAGLLESCSTPLTSAHLKVPSYEPQTAFVVQVLMS